jgi:hypothetical protein
MDDMDTSTGSAQPLRLLQSAPNSDTSHLAPTVTVQDTSTDNQVDRLQHDTHSPSSKPQIQTDAFQISLATLTIMEPKSAKRAHSPEKVEAGHADSAVDGTSNAVKRMKLDHKNCTCGISHDKGLSIQSEGARTPNWTEVIRHVLKIGDNVAAHKV